VNRYLAVTFNLPIPKANLCVCSGKAALKLRIRKVLKLASGD